MVKQVRIAGHTFFRSEKKKDGTQAACFDASGDDKFFVALQVGETRHDDTRFTSYIYASFADHLVFYEWMKTKHAVFRNKKEYGEQRCFYQLNRSVETDQTSCFFADIEWVSGSTDPTA